MDETETTGEAKTAKEIEMTVMEVGNLPEKFRPSPASVQPTAELPDPLANLIKAATSDLTSPEREVFLRRLKEEHPGLFSGETGGKSQGLEGELPENFSEQEWGEALARVLKKEANRFMAAAVDLQSNY